MKDRSNSSKIIKNRIIINILIVIFAIVGIFLNINEPNASKNTILYFTTQSNIWIMFICLIMLFYDILHRKVPKVVYVIKYIFTVSILVTGIVYNLILAPQYANCFGSFFRAYSLSVTILHVIVPLLGFISYILFDEKIFKKKFNLLGCVMPLLYFLFIIILSVVSTNDYLFDGIGGVQSKFPYFFLDYINNGWFTLTRDISKLGTFYWFIICLIFTIIISQALLYIQRKVSRTNLYENYIQK